MGRIKKRPRANTGDLVKKFQEAEAVQRESSTEASNAVDSNSDIQISVLPQWYLEAKPPAKSNTGERRTIDKLVDLRQLILKCEQATSKAERRAIMAHMYEEIDTLRFTDVTPWSLRRAKILDQEHGLPRIYDSKLTKGVEYPTYIRTDALGLHRRWHVEIFDGSNMFRGIKNMAKQKDSKAQGSSIDQEYKKSWRYHGEGHLVNGDWFANQLCAVRDGAHGSAQAGISGVTGTGATSISMSGDLYKDTDRDELDEIWYSGTPQTKAGDYEKTAATQLLFDSEVSKEPVRVLRSMNLPKSNVYRPERGFRYDGLYTVKSHKCIDLQTHHYLFHLVRNPGQDPIRYEGIGVRPTIKEIETYDKEMKMFGRKAF